MSAWAWHREFRRLNASGCVFEKGTVHAGTSAMECGARFAFKAFVTIEQLEPPLLPRASRRSVGGLVPGLGLWRRTAQLQGWLRSLAPHRTICITQAVRKALAGTYGFNPSKLVVIHNGVDANRFRPRPERRHDARTILGLRANEFVFGSMCRLIPDKGVDVAIRAVAALRRRETRPIRYVIAGDGTERRALESLARELELDDVVTFAGFLREPADFYSALDAFIVPSRIEAQGIVVLEAMASGCDVIASAVGGIPEMIDRPGIGRLVAADDVAALASAMTETLNQQESDRHSRSTSAREHVMQHFSADDQYGKIITLVEHLLRD